MEHRGSPVLHRGFFFYIPNRFFSDLLMTLNLFLADRSCEYFYNIRGFKSFTEIR